MRNFLKLAKTCDIPEYQVEEMIHENLVIHPTLKATLKYSKYLSDTVISRFYQQISSSYFS